MVAVTAVTVTFDVNCRKFPQNEQYLYNKFVIDKKLIIFVI